MQKTRYVYSRPYVPKGTRRTEVLTTILDWETLQFEKTYHVIRCRELCLLWGGKKCILADGREQNVCSFFTSSCQISEETPIIDGE